MLKKIFPFILTAAAVMAGCSADEQPATVDQPNESINEQENQAVEAVMENLEVPWSIEKIGDTFYLTERAGHIVKIEDEKMERQEIDLQKTLSTAAEAGLLGFVLAPDFPESNQAFAYYTYEDDDGQFNRVVTLRLEDGTWTEEELLLDRIPSGAYHHGGRLKIGPDEKLYATTGDATVRDSAQDMESLGGKILRMNLDGSIPDDNPDSNSYVYSYGHRNPQGLAWSADGELFASEHGNNANDEINRIEAGQNYGWPLIEGAQEQEGMIAPLFTSGAETTWAPSGMDYDNGKLYVAALRGTAVLTFDPTSGEQKEIVTGLGRIRDVLVDGDYLYFITNNSDGRGNPEENGDKLYRLRISESN